MKIYLVRKMSQHVGIRAIESLIVVFIVVCIDAILVIVNQ